MDRDKSLDIAKGIGILLMVIGHCYHTENIVLKTIYSFHMPLFFIVSGMLLSMAGGDLVLLSEPHAHWFHISSLSWRIFCFYPHWH